MASWLPLGDIEETVPANAIVVLDTDETFPNAEVISADINSRSLDAAEAVARTIQAITLINDYHQKNDVVHQVFFKFDSLLRGNIAAQLGAASKSMGPIVFCPAVPALNRVVQGGIIKVNGVPLHETGLWHLESEFAPESVSSVFTGLNVLRVSLDQIRNCELAALFKSVAPEIQVVLCDAESDEDLRTLASAIHESELTAAGASGLCAALAKVLPQAPTAPTARLDLVSTPTEYPSNAGTLFVIGTASEQARAQVKRLSEEGIPVIAWRPGGSAELPDGDCVVTVSGPIRSGSSADIDHGLARLVARNHRGRDLFLTGGQTARSILDALKIAQLYPLTQPEFGTVISRTPNGQLIATRPGSFGSTDNLLYSFRAFKHLRALYAPNERTSS